MQALRARRLGSQKLRGDLRIALLLYVRLAVHVDHRVRADRPFQLLERLPFARMRIDEGFSCHPHGLVHRKESAIVGEHPQLGFLDLGVGGIHVDQVHRSVIDRLKAQGVLHAVDLLRIQVQVIVLRHPREAILAIHELVAESGLDVVLNPRQIADGVQIVLLGEGLLHRQRVGVIEAQWLGDRQIPSSQARPECPRRTSSPAV